MSLTVGRFFFGPRLPSSAGREISSNPASRAAGGGSPGTASQKCLQSRLDVLDASLENTADDVAIVDALNAVFFEDSVLQQCDAALELFDIDQQEIALLLCRQAEDSFHFFNHAKIGLKVRLKGENCGRAELTTAMRANVGKHDPARVDERRSARRPPARRGNRLPRPGRTPDAGSARRGSGWQAGRLSAS